MGRYSLLRVRRISTNMRTFVGCMLLLILLGSVTRESCAAFVPSKISYFVTVRSFMAANCRNISSSDSIRSSFCPDDPAIIQQVVQGTISGHPDFQRQEYPQLYYPGTSATYFYNNTFAKYGRPFPITATWDIENTLSRPVVLSSLAFDTAGIPKMRYCHGEEGYPCDVNSTNRTVMNEQSFSTWYADSKLYNKRLGYKQDLFATSDNRYQFNAGNSSQNPLGNGLYDPITQHNLSSKAWPLSQYEKTGYPLPCSFGSGCPRGKFWFTTEIHTNFQYMGGEQFTFSGDDDVYVFLNGRLAVNLGGVHTLVMGTIDLDTYAQELNITKGQVYAFDLFHAERQTKGSNYALTTTLGQTCNVVTSDFRSNGTDVTLGVDWTDSAATETRTKDSDWFLLGGPGFAYISSPLTVTLMAPNVPDVVSYMFHRSQQNIGSGFALSFQFRMTGSRGHGFSLLVHDRPMGIHNFNGGTGPNMGLRNLENSFAVVFDMCPNFPACGDGSQQVRLHYNEQGGMNENTIRTRRVYDPAVLQSWTDGQLHTVNVFYYAVPDWLEVYVDDSLRLVERNFSVERIVKNRNAYIGFASSSSANSTLQVEISQVAVKTVKVSSKLSTLVTANDSFPLQLIANGQQTSGVTFQTRDACGNKLQFGGLASLARGRAVRRVASSRRRLQQSPNNSSITINGTIYMYYDAEVIDNQDGSYSLQFRTMDLGDYAIYASFGDTCTWNHTSQSYQGMDDCWTLALPDAMTAIPYVTAAPTKSSGEPQSLDLPWNIIYGVGIGLGGIIFCIFCVLLVMLRYRRKWRADKKFVQQGQLAILDNQVELSGNPLGQKLQVMSDKLQTTKSEVLKLRAVSGSFATEEELNLSHETKRLKDEVKLLKRKQQEDEILEVSKSDRTLARDRSSTSRIGFKPEPVAAGAMTVSLDEILSDVPPPPPSTVIVPPVFVEHHNPRASFLVSISRRDITFMMDLSNDNFNVIAGGNIYGQFYENGDVLAMHCIGPGTNARMDKDGFIQSESFLKEASEYLGKHSAFQLGAWYSTSIHGKPVSEILKLAEDQCRQLGNPEYFLCLLVQLCGVKHEKMVVTVTPYRFHHGKQVSKQNIGDLYVFEDDTDSEAINRHKALEVMRSRPPPLIARPPPPLPASPGTVPPPLPPPRPMMSAEPPTKRRFEVDQSPVPPPLPPSRVAPPPGLSPPDSQSGVLVVTPRRMSLGGDDEQSLVPAILDGPESGDRTSGKSRFTFFGGNNGNKQ